MILVRLEIENYKQYAGSHRIEPSANGIVGVLGPNGVGKTTLFEAIEWCLYNPREISTDEVRSRTGTGHTRVRVTLEDPRDGVRYVVERVRKAKAISADLYREDQPENRIVTGTRQVTDYVARQLVGLSHRAFVSTFFTRQKELSFFGTLKDTDRRREVGRLLGLETIREAQRRLAEDRNEARAESQGLTLQYREASEGRDFATERAAAGEEVAARKHELTTASDAVAAAGRALIETGLELARWHELERHDNAFALQLERLAGEHRAQEVAKSTAEDELRRLDAAAATRLELLPVAESLVERTAMVEQFVADRERFELSERLRERVARAEEATAQAAKRLNDLVTRTSTGGDIPDGWLWTSGDATNVSAAVDRLVRAAESLDVDHAEQAATVLAACLARATERDQQAKRVDLYRARMKSLKAQEQSILAVSDPNADRDAARELRETEQAVAQRAAARRQAEATARGHLESARKSLQRFDFSVPCPTCQRPFTADEAGVVVSTLTVAIDAHTVTEQQLLREQKAAEQRAADATIAEEAAERRVSELKDAQSRISQGEQHLAEAEQELDLAFQRCDQALEEAGLEVVPSPEVAREAADRAARLRTIAQAIQSLQQMGSDTRVWREEREAATNQLSGLGIVTYDQTAHEQAQSRLDEAGRARARVDEIERMLARRPSVEEGMRAAGLRQTEIQAEIEQSAAERAKLGFQAAGLATAQEAQRQATEVERAAISRQHLAQGGVNDAERFLQELEREEARLMVLAERAALRAKDADELDRMYREFSRFDQWVAEQVTPQLAEHTGELLGAVTEGKYDRVEFDENYGLRIFDEDESFPLDSFSGGERDVAALCARLALSRLVGGQSGHPPEFLVLDEVFGSLDRDRRTQVLEMLSTLAASTEAFRQLFIISHVDDVRTSAVFNQIWRIQEEENGSSRVEDITAGGGGDEI